MSSMVNERGKHIDPLLGLNLVGDVANVLKAAPMDHDAENVLLLQGDGKERARRSTSTTQVGCDLNSLLTEEDEVSLQSIFLSVATKGHADRS